MYVKPNFSSKTTFVIVLKLGFLILFNTKVHEVDITETWSTVLFITFKIPQVVIFSFQLFFFIKNLQFFYSFISCADSSVFLEKKNRNYFSHMKT